MLFRSFILVLIAVFRSPVLEVVVYFIAARSQSYTERPESIQIESEAICSFSETAGHNVDVLLNNADLASASHHNFCHKKQQCDRVESTGTSNLSNG